jgi:hypothetical protein
LQLWLYSFENRIPPILASPPSAMTALLPLLKSIDEMFPISLKKERLRIRNPKELFLLFQEVCRCTCLLNVLLSLISFASFVSCFLHSFSSLQTMRLAAGDTRYNSLNSFFNTTFGNRDGHSSGGAGLLTLSNRRGSESHLPGSSLASSSSASRTAIAMANLVSPGRALSMTNMNLSISLSRSVDPFSQLPHQSGERERGLVPEAATPKQASLTPSTSSNKLNPSSSAFKLVLK